MRQITTQKHFRKAAIFNGGLFCVKELLAKGKEPPKTITGLFCYAKKPLRKWRGAGPQPFLSDTITFLSNTSPFLSDTISFLSNTSPFLSDTISFLSNASSFLSDTITFLSNALVFPEGAKGC